tara:strand:- start:141 stop:506 length:366 start_codon:yes stop_codon:yes gene_type:complete
MITDLNKTQNNITELESLKETRYENIFKMAKSDAYFFYNIIKKISLPDDIQEEVFFNIRVNARKPWTALSHDVYGTQDLWWLICIVNKVYNPINNPEPGRIYKVIKPDLIDIVLAEITRQL